MSFLNDLTRGQISGGAFPLHDILNNACYYPASGFDGRPIRYCNLIAQNLDIQNFIYCDFAVDANALRAQQEDFTGYRLVGTRELQPSDLVPNGWQQVLPPSINKEQYMQTIKDPKTSFAHWLVYERAPDFGTEHGPDRFSLLYIRGEGVATYQALFWSNHAAPKVLVVTEHGFGGWCADFGAVGAPLNWVSQNNVNGILPYVMFNNGALAWPNYRQIGEWNGFTIWEYMGPEGE
ncbi:MAG: hypothetical protein EOO10_20440 [Chitinophagaceae bacterium]|nr:MAG: hypothetical protein EOO10_20440 [Chitinophagaceae bacterium]